MIKDHSRLIVRKASAGAGKTFTLVKEYIKLAFTGSSESDLDSQFGHILAITFTNKAANEMKERIMTYLDEISELGEESGMAQAVHADTGLPFDTLVRYAGRVKRAILHNYSDLSVCTIDSFMHRIVKTFAHDLNLPMNFDVLLDSNDLIQTSVDDLMGLIGQQEEADLTQMLCDFAYDQMEDGKSFNIENKISDLAKQLFTEGTAEKLAHYKDMTPADFGRLQKQFRQDNRNFLNSIRTTGQKAVDLIRSGNVGIDAFPGGKSGIGGYFAKLAKGIPAKGSTNVDNFVSGKSLAKSGTDQQTQDRILALRPQLLELYHDAERTIGEGLVLYNSRCLILKNLYSIGVLNRLSTLMGEESYSEEVVHISEFNRRISDIVEEEPMPFIYERVGNRYKYILIDEFQDTSLQQWQNLLPLVDNAVAQGHTCLIVGDGKQAIYRFRKGDVGQFVDLPKVRPNPHGHGLILQAPGVADVAGIDTNYRTRERVVAFNNSLYNYLAKNTYAANDEIRKIYIGDDPDRPALTQKPVKEGGYVQIEFMDLKDDLSPMWEALRKDIRRQVAMGYRYSDITILGRDNKELSLITQHFTQHPDEEGVIPMVSSESFLLKNSPTVMLMRALLYYLLDNQDRVAATQALTLLRQMGLTRHDFTADLLDEGGDNLVDLNQILAHDDILFDIGHLRSLTLYDCCEELVRRLGLEGTDTAYMTSLLNVVAAYSKGHRQDLAEFLEWFDKNLDKLSSNAAGAQNAVRLMTIHKSKGLEAKIIMYVIPPSRPKANTIWVDIDRDDLPIRTCIVTPTKDTETVFDDQVAAEAAMAEMDKLNVLYVATTRPKSKLMIYSSMPPEKSSAAPSYQKMLYNFATKGGSDAFSLMPAERDGRTLHIAGEDIRYNDKDEETKPNVEVSGLSYDSWNSRVRIAEQAKRIFDNASMERIQEGVVVHDVLALMHSTDDAHKAIEQYAAQNNLDEEKRQAIREQIEKLLQNKAFTRFFDPRHDSINECSMVMDYTDRDGTRRRGTKRPDRIVLAGDETWVVDFKTGSHTKENEQQVRNYCAAIEQMGYPGVQGFLLYLQHGSCVVRQVV